MSDDDPHDSSTAQWRREHLVARFEDAWRQGVRPVIDDFLPDDDPDRLAVLIELVHTDLEYRLKAGDEVAVEQYWGRYPELRQDRTQAVSLIAAEYGHRRRRSPEVTPVEFLQRFADFGDELRQRLEESAGGDPAAGEPVPAELPRIPGYEILAVLGHGGMGVVYQARQLSLNRLVALKMILAGLPEDSQGVARFRTEAETVARLQHPNIVQIHEIGEAAGRPYLALEFVAGGSLERHLGGNPQPAAEAARLVETLAQAMAYAHERGVVHRDLKPANILLSGEGRVARDEPENPLSSLAPRPSPLATLKITDFGLAKRLDLPAGHTRSGAVVGTPSYMAPEQALGHTGAVGPAADIYALGVILYELLTGRPPFKGASALDTVWQVLHEEPVAPTRLQPRVPRDLETVCLTCLHKDPRKRYASAEALAEDLRRFRAGEPIRARRTRPWERAAKWARRRPAAAGLIGVSVLGLLLLTGGGLFYGARLRAERDRAERNSRHALEAADTLVGELAEGIKPIAGTRSATVYHILDRAAHVYEDLLREEPSPRVLEGKARMLTAFATIYLEANHSGKAVDSARAAVAILEPLTHAAPGDARLRHGLARAQEALGRTYHEQEYPEPALAALRAALDLDERLTRQEPANVARQADLARVYGCVGNVLLEQQDVAGARAVFEKALAVEERLERQQAGQLAWRREWAVAHEHLGDVFFQTSAYAQAVASYETALARYRQLVDGDPTRADWLRDLARVQLSLGSTFYWDNQPAKARADYEGALQIAERLVRSDPANTQWQRLELGCRSQLLNLALEKPQPDLLREKLRLFREIARLADRFAGQDPQRLRWRHDLAVSRLQLARVHQALAARGIAPAENFAASHKALDDVIAIEKKVVGEIPNSLRGLALLYSGYFSRANLYAAEGKPREAERASAEAARTDLRRGRCLAGLYPADFAWQWQQVRARWQLSIHCRRLADLGVAPAENAAETSRSAAEAQAVCDELLRRDPAALTHCRETLGYLSSWYQDFTTSNPGPVIAAACLGVLRPLLHSLHEGRTEARPVLADGVALLHKLRAAKHLSPEQQEALRQLEEALNPEPSS